MKVLSVVCARAGSKGLKNKCVAQIGNKMVVEYSIDYSLSLGSDVRTVVSTDIEELIDYCKARTIEYIHREPHLCTDECRITDALADAIEKRGKDCEYTSLVYGNIPTRYPEIFHKALSFLEKNEEYDAGISMQNVEKFNPEWMFDLNEEIVPRVKQRDYQRQRLPQKMIHDGHSVVFKSGDFYKRYKGILPYEAEYAYSIFGSKIKPLINNKVIIDIDTEKDLRMAEAFFGAHA
jgi:CMP-N-acetylneuraminic acid synthetase